ncbi:hypothetical protein D047_4713B, partial [Vibrio parahaemolyticus VPTS-2010_2]
VVGTIFLEI